MILRPPGADELITIGVVGEEVKPLPGILESVEVSSSLLTDDVGREGMSGKVKVIHGWSDADVTVTLILVDIPAVTNTSVTKNITRYDCLSEIAATFKKVKDGKPQIYTISTLQTAAWGIQQFVFNSLKSSENRAKQIITCTLEFDEYDSTTGKSQGRQIDMQNAAPEAEVNVEAEMVGAKDRGGLGEVGARYVSK